MLVIGKAAEIKHSLQDPSVFYKDQPLQEGKSQLQPVSITEQWSPWSQLLEHTFHQIPNSLF